MTPDTPSLRPALAADYDAWLALWRGYQAFYKADIAEATAVYHLMRNLGSSFFISICVAEIVRSTTTNYSRLVEALTPFNKLLSLPSVLGAWDVDTVNGLARMSREIGRAHRTRTQIMRGANDFRVEGDQVYTGNGEALLPGRLTAHIRNLVLKARNQADKQVDQTLLLLPPALRTEGWLGIHVPGLGVILTLVIVLVTVPLVAL